MKDDNLKIFRLITPALIAIVGTLILTNLTDIKRECKDLAQKVGIHSERLSAIEATLKGGIK